MRALPRLILVLPPLLVVLLAVALILRRASLEHPPVAPMVMIESHEASSPDLTPWIERLSKTLPATPSHATTFNGRPLRPVKSIRMKVTAYSPDARSCGKWADDFTASGYSVFTNGMKLVAADTRILPFGSIISVPGYHDGQPVMVLDRGGKIKGHRLDLLMPTHQEARRFGAKHLDITLYDYAD